MWNSHYSDCHSVTKLPKMNWYDCLMKKVNYKNMRQRRLLLQEWGCNRGYKKEVNLTFTEFFSSVEWDLSAIEIKDTEM